MNEDKYKVGYEDVKEHIKIEVKKLQIIQRL